MYSEFWYLCFDTLELQWIRKLLQLNDRWYERVFVNHISKIVENSSDNNLLLNLIFRIYTWIVEWPQYTIKFNCSFHHINSKICSLIDLHPSILFRMTFSMNCYIVEYENEKNEKIFITFFENFYWKIHDKKKTNENI